MKPGRMPIGLSDFMGSALKNNSDLMRGVVTGIMRVAKESIFSGLNNATVYSIPDEELNTAIAVTFDGKRTYIRTMVL